MSVYANIETGFTQCHNGTEGAGGCPAKTALSLPLGNGQILTIQGATKPENANVLWYQGLPFVPGATNFLWEYDVGGDANEANVWARERDFYVVNNGQAAQFGCQLLKNANGYELDISDQNFGWANTGLTVPLLGNTMHHFTHIGYLSGGVYSYRMIVIDGKEYAIPASLQNFKTASLEWANVIQCQWQQDLDGAQNQNLGFSEFVTGMNLIAW
jgi:hypothetical protein